MLFFLLLLELDKVIVLLIHVLKADSVDIHELLHNINFGLEPYLVVKLRPNLKPLVAHDDVALLVGSHDLVHFFYFDGPHDRISFLQCDLVLPGIGVDAYDRLASLKARQQLRFHDGTYHACSAILLRLEVFGLLYHRDGVL